MKTQRAADVALLCNPLAGGRWRALADVLDSEEAKSAHRIVTDEIADVREAIMGVGQRVKLLCIYGGDGTIYHVINELVRDPNATPPRIALLGGGTMNVTAAWCGMSSSPGDNFRQVMRAYLTDQLLWREVPLLAVTQDGKTRYGFTFGMGPLIRILVRFEQGAKSKAAAVGIGLKSIASAITKFPRGYQHVLDEMQATIQADGATLGHDRYAAVFANVTGVINPMVAPFVGERSRDSFHFLAYAVSAREFALMAPLLARAKLPRKNDPRYHNHAAREVILETSEPHYTLDGEVFASTSSRIELRLGPTLQLATLGGRLPPAEG
ncbi:MAG: diacylglycerol kinase family protein [Polyangiaceae bacterium]